MKTMKQNLNFRSSTSSFKWVLFLSLITVALGCSKNGTDDETGPSSQLIKIQIPVASAITVTRSAADEVKIKKAYVIVYGARDQTKPKFAEEVSLENIKPAGTADGDFTILAFSPSDNIVEGDNIHIMFNKEVANFANISKANLIKHTMLTSADGLVLLPTGLPMHGQDIWTNNGSPIIKVKRAVAKVQLKLDYGVNGIHVPGEMGSSFTVEKTTYKLYQLSNQGYIDGSFMASTTSNPIETIDNEALINNASALMNDNETGASLIFAYPYATQSIGAPLAKFTDTESNINRIAMIIKNEISSGKYIYHRLDFYDQATEKYLNIENNNHYSIRITKIDNGGYKSATEALTHPASNIEFEIVTEEDGTSITNGQYALNVNPMGNNFDVSKPTTVMELAKVNRSASANTGLTAPTPFSVSIEESSRTGSVKITFVELPNTLDHNIKSINITASGDGVVLFKYVCQLGNIKYVSKLITLRSVGVR